MRSWLACLIAVLSLAAPADARSLLDAGVVALDADVAPTPDCTVGLDAELCVVTWERNGSLPDDDSFIVAKDVRSVNVTLRPGVGPPMPAVRLGPGGIVLANPVFPLLNKTWIGLGSQVPPTAQTFVTLDSRPPHHQPNEWGLFVTLHPPFPVETPFTEPLYDVGEPVVCWHDVTCKRVAWEDNHVFTSNETTLVLLPDSVFLNDWSTDTFVSVLIGSTLECPFPYFMTPETCALLAEHGATLNQTAALYASVTPNVRTGFRLERIRAGGDNPASGSDAALLGGRGAALHAAYPGGAVVATRAPLLTAPAAFPAPGSTLIPPPLRDDGAERVASVVLQDEQRQPGLPFLAAVLIGTASLFAAWWLYARVTRERVLLQPTRRAVYDCIVANPGIRVGSVARILELNYKTVLQHAERLRMHGLIRAVGVGQQRYYAAAACPASESVALVLANPAAAGVLRVVQAQRCVDLEALQRELGLAKSTTSQAVTRLVLVGLVTRRVVHRRVVVSLACPHAPTRLGG